MKDDTIEHDVPKLKKAILDIHEKRCNPSR